VSEDSPNVLLSGTELWQWAQAINTVSQVIGRMRHRTLERRQQEGRLAHGDAEHAARLHEVRAHPPLRLMTDEEQAEWFSRVPPESAGQYGDEPFTVWTARLGQQWGVEAHTWSPTGAPTSSLFVVCRDGQDAAELCRWLRQHNSPDDMGRVHGLAAGARNADVEPETVAPHVRKEAASNRVVAPVLSESDWEQALRTELPTRLADRVIVKDPTHPHHTAWRELHRLANEEVARVGADPALLAKLVHIRPVWRETVRNPPALAHWAITEERTSPGYERLVKPRASSTSESLAASARPGEVFIVEGHVEPARRPLSQVRSPQQAMEWAAGLNAHNLEHRIEAKQGFGHWGPTVDAALAAKFDTLMATTDQAAQRQRRREDRRRGPVETVAAGSAEVTLEPAAEAMLAEDVGRLHPAAAHAMLGHVNPDVDRLLAQRFGDDPRFAEKLRTLYPTDGQLETEAGAYRARADVNLRRAAAHLAEPDVAATSVREDVLGRDAATSDHGAAAAELAAATAARAEAKRPITVPGDPRPGRVR
jgi:hypothetical protein